VSINSVRNTVLNKFDFQTKARPWCAFVLSVFLLFPLGAIAAADSPCVANEYHETVDLKNVIDGDTLLLTDGRFVRLIGVNTPELGREKEPSEPFADEARQALLDILDKTKQIRLVFDKEKRDRYQRVLAHAFLPNGKNIQFELLKAGMAQHIMIPPNDGFYACYRSAEQQAQSSKQGIWSHKRYRVMHADELTLRHVGFYRVKGRVSSVHRKKGNYWLELNERFSFRIDREDMKYFKRLRPETLKTHSIQAKGWIFPYKSGLNMRIQHPKNILILD
jgi:endonuclease YncB( thermonuclease family)